MAQNPFLAAGAPMPSSDSLPAMSVHRCAAAWNAALKLTAAGQSIDQAAMLKIAKSIVGAKSSISAGSLSPDMLTARRTVLAAALGPPGGVMTMTTTEQPPKKHHGGNGNVPTVTGYDGYLNRSVRLQRDLTERLIRAARKANVTPSSLIRAILSSSLPDLPDLVDGDQ